MMVLPPTLLVKEILSLNSKEAEVRQVHTIKHYIEKKNLFILSDWLTDWMTD